MKLPEMKELPTQELVDSLTAERDALAAQIETLETWVAAVADEHDQIPAWIRASAKELLAELAKQLVRPLRATNCGMMALY